MNKTMDIIKANDSLEQIYKMANIMDCKETQRVIDALDQPNPMSGLFGSTPEGEARVELVRIIRAHALLENLTRDGAIALRDLLGKTRSTITITPELWGYLTEKERIVRAHEVNNLWRTLHGEELGDSDTSGLFVPYHGDDMP